jgi:hypothetical protein
MNAKNKPNGRTLLADRGGAPGEMLLLRGMGRAASDDAREFAVASSVAVSAAASAGREAYAEVAQAPGEGEQLPLAATAPRSRRNGTGQENATDAKAKTRKRKVGPGLEPLPIDGEAFVDAVHSRVDLVKLEEKLLHSKDEKIVQRELACLRELRYGKRAPAADDDAPQIILDMQRPEREAL